MVGTRDTFKTFTPLLSGIETNSSATLITLFMNTVNEAVGCMENGTASQRKQTESRMKREVDTVWKYLGDPRRLIGDHDPKLIMAVVGRFCVRDDDHFFDK